jgi:hypothetical protein
MSHALLLSYRFDAANVHDPKRPLPTKGAGTLRRAVRSFAFARILGGRHMECTYYFEILGGRHMECAYYFEIVGYVQTATTVERRGYNG